MQLALHFKGDAYPARMLLNRTAKLVDVIVVYLCNSNVCYRRRYETESTCGVYENNPAREIYLKLGFNEIGIVDGVVRMSLPLKNNIRSESAPFSC